MANKRLIPRVHRRLRVTVNGHAVFTADISPGGFCVELMDVLPIGSDLKGELELGGASFAYSGKVMWNVAGEKKINKRGRMGVKFMGIDPAFFEAYLALLNAPDAAHAAAPSR